MKLMDRYIIRELIVPFLAGSIAIALLFAANQLIYIMKSFNVQNVPVSAMLQMIFYRMPFWLNMTLPAGISLAASLAITRLSRESEITAMRAVGVRVSRLIVPVAAFGLAVAVGNYFLVEDVIPKTERKAHKLEIDTAVVSASPMFRSNVWLTLKQYSASLGSISRKSDDSLEIANIMLGERPTGDTVTFISAPKGTYKNGIWRLEDVTYWQLSPSSLSLMHGTGKVMEIPQPIFLNDLFDQQESQDKTGPELAAAIKTGKAAGHDMTREEMLYAERFSVPAACIVFAIVAPIFAIVFARSGSFAGVLLSIILVMLYYNAFIISTEIFGRNHWFSPWVAAWAPNFGFAALGLLGIRRLE